MKINNPVFGIILFFLGLVGLSVSIAFQPVSAPNVIFNTITGETVALKKLKGKPVLITFWATNCKTCIEEIPQLNQLYNNYHSQGLQIIAISMHYDQPSRVVNMSKARNIKYHVALDIRKEYAAAFGDVQLIPQTLLISPSGEIDMQITGLINMQQLTQRIEFFLQG